MDFFGNRTFLNGVDDDLNELIKWLEDIDRPKNKYMDNEGLSILQKNGYISTRRILFRASLIKGSNNNKEKFKTEIKIKKKLKNDHLSSLVSAVISKFKKSKGGAEKIAVKQAKLRTTALCWLPPKVCPKLVQMTENSDLDMGKKVSLYSCLSTGGDFQNSWKRKLTEINIRFDNKTRDQLPDDLIESYTQWVWELILKNKTAEASFKSVFLESLQEWQKKQLNMDVNTVSDVINALLEHTLTFEFSVKKS